MSSWPASPASRSRWTTTDAICGYASWNRGQGYGEQAVISVADLLATSADGYRALLAMVGSFASVTAIDQDRHLRR